MNWTKFTNQDFTIDSRGWKKGKSRTHTDADKKLVKKLRRKLEKSKDEFYIGPETIFDKIEESDYPRKKKINLSFIKKTLKDAKLSKPHKKKVRGASSYQCYPDALINDLGLVILEIDFLERHIKGQTKPLNFISFSCKKLKLRQFKRISAQTGACAREQIKWFFDNFFIPDVSKMDNGLAFIGSASGKRSLSKTVIMLFQEKVIPVFTNPRSPWNNGSVEGSNSVFARNFWNKFIFNSVEEVDATLEAFNKSSLERSKFNKENFEQKIKTNFVPKIYFIRKVYEDQKNGKGRVDILNDKIYLPNEYINLFTLSEWNLKTEILTVLFEKDKKEKIIKNIKFKINQKSRGGCITFI